MMALKLKQEHVVLVACCHQVGTVIYLTIVNDLFNC